MTRKINNNIDTNKEKTPANKIFFSFDKEVINKTYALVSRYVSKFILDNDTANNITQEIVVKIRTNIEDGKYQENWKFQSWCLKISYNCIIDFFRRNKKEKQFPMSDFIDNGFFDHIPHLSIEDKIIAEETYKKLQVAISKLPKEQKEVIQLRVYDELPFKDIAEKTNVSINTVLWRYRYARISLLKILLYNGKK